MKRQVGLRLLRPRRLCMMLGNDRFMQNVKDLERETWEQKRYKSNQIIETIKLQADFFEMKTRVKPTIFMSYDLFALVAAVNRDAFGREVLVHRIDKNTSGLLVVAKNDNAHISLSSQIEKKRRN